MDGATDGSMLPEAEAAYKGVRGNPAEVGPVAAVLVDRTRAAGQTEAHVVALHAQAWAEHEVLRNEVARTLLDRALRVAARARLEHRVGDLLVSRAAVNQELGRLGAAHRDLQRAEGLLPSDRRPRLLLQRAVVDHNAGHLRPAATRYQLLAGDPRTDDEVRAKAANNLAELELSRGRPQAALPWIDLAVTLAPAVGPVMVAYSAQTRARVYVQAGRLAQGLACFAHARYLYDAAGLAVGGHLVEYADALLDLRLLPEALAAAREGAALLAIDDASLMAPEAELRVARLELVAGNRDAAKATAARAADRLRRQRRTPWVARAVLVEQQALDRPDARVLRRVARVLDDAGLVHDAVDAHLAAGRAAAADSDDSAARASLTRAAVRARRAPLLVRLSGRIALAERAVLQGESATTVVRACRQGLDDLAAHRLALPSAELRALASGHGVELARLGLRALLPQASPARVLGWLELMRGAAIGGTSSVPVAQDDHVTRLRALHAELAATRGRAEPDPPHLLAELATVEDTLRRGSWLAAGAVDPTGRVGLADLRERLEDRLLVELAELDGRLLAVVVGRRPVRVVDLGPVAPVAQATAMLHFALRRLAVPGLDPSRAELVGGSARTTLARLADRLVRPLGIDPDASLVVAPVGALQLVPWGSLHRGPVSVTPSASLWAATAGPARPGPLQEGVVLVAGPDLPGADDEVARLAGVHPGAAVLVGDGARAADVLAALRGTALVHLSCHGTVRSDSPTFSSLQMADGPLTLHEILTGGTAPERVVLAACDSAVETTYPGDEALGFVSALLSHGSRAVVASTVLVPDRAAVPLMVGLHEGLARGLTASDALHAARADTETDSPAGFVASCAFTAFGAG